MTRLSFTTCVFFVCIFGLSACGGGGGNGGGNQPPVDNDLDWDQGNWDEENWQ